MLAALGHTPSSQMSTLWRWRKLWLFWLKTMRILENFLQFHVRSKCLYPHQEALILHVFRMVWMCSTHVNLHLLFSDHVLGAPLPELLPFILPQNIGKHGWKPSNRCPREYQTTHQVAVLRSRRPAQWSRSSSSTPAMTTMTHRALGAPRRRGKL